MYIAVANAFLFILIRYGCFDWAPTLNLSEVKDFTVNKSSWPTFYMNGGCFLGTFTAAVYISDKWFKGRRGPRRVILYMVLVLSRGINLLVNPAGNPAIDIRVH